ncbi:MAG: TraB/GumN family protein [Wenzhouxiangellaceae bacterium]
MNDSATTDPRANIPVEEPRFEIERDGVHYTVLGTAHVSLASARAVEAAIEDQNPEAVAVELCPSRHRALTDPDAWRQIDLFTVLREGKAGMMMASLVLAAYQRRIAEQFGIAPGAEMRTAIRLAERKGLALQLIDREIGITLKRVRARLSLWQRWLLTNGLIASLFAREEVSAEDIESLKQGDVLTQAFSEFAQQSPALYEVLITERDRYMAAKLRQYNRDAPGRHVLAVVGAGHLDGIRRALQADCDPDQEIRELESIPPPSRLWKLLPWLIVVAVLSGFAIGFSRSPELGWSLITTWVVINGGLSALGAAIATAHPVTIASALLAAPLTSLNPTIGAGMVAGAVEAWLRRPRIGDFEHLRDDVTRIHGWWRNRVARVLLVFFLANLGSAIGTWVAGASIVRQLL